MEKAIIKTDIKEYQLLARGKVRDVYDLVDALLFVATDRISAFDWVLPSGIPGKGKILNSMSLFWFDFTKKIIPNHVKSGNFEDFPSNLKKYDSELRGRSMIVKKARRIDIECVARGYLVGSGYKDYKKLLESSPGANSVRLYDNELPSNLIMADKLPAPIFTPATKVEDGHDQNISFSRMAEFTGMATASKLKQATLDIYKSAADYAYKKGVIIADTKFEFGFVDNKLTLIDEILSPDSSRFWPLESYRPGSNPPSYDKQFIRDWLEKSGWDKNSPPPELPDDVIENTINIYKKAHRILVGKDIEE